MRIGINFTRKGAQFQRKIITSCLVIGIIRKFKIDYGYVTRQFSGLGIVICAWRPTHDSLSNSEASISDCKY